MSQGQPDDLRPMRKLKSTDYYEAKGVVEQTVKTSWDKCEICGLEINEANKLGKSYRGSSSEKRICQQCWNEKVI